MNWIPYKPNYPLPKDKEQVLVTYKWGENDYEVGMQEYWEVANSEHEKRFGNWDKFVVAWMPKPKEYRE